MYSISRENTPQKTAFRNAKGPGRDLRLDMALSTFPRAQPRALPTGHRGTAVTGLRETCCVCNALVGIFQELNAKAEEYLAAHVAMPLRL